MEEVCKKSVFPTSFSRVHFHGKLFSFESESDLLIIYLTSLTSQMSFYYRLLHSCSRIVTFGLYKQPLDFLKVIKFLV